MRLTLKDDGYPTFKVICQGRNRIGRVYRAADGTFRGIINCGRGKPAIEGAGPTETIAFEETAAKAMGFDSAAALRARNAAVRNDNRVQRAALNGLVNAARNGDLAPFRAAIDRFIREA